jgi:hypothetical protein
MANEIKDTVILELKINEASAGKSAPQAKKEVEALATSIIGLTQQNKKLREERNKLDTANAQDVKRIQELNKVIDANTKVIKDNTSQIEQQRANIGNYKSALDDFEGSVDKSTGSLTAFLNPVTGIIAAGAGLLAFYTSSTAGARDLAKSQDLLSGAFDVARESAGNFFKTLGDGEKGPIESFTDAVLFQISPALAAMANVSAAAKETLRELEISAKFAQQFAKDDERKAEEQRRIRDDEKKSIDERIAASNQITSIMEASGQRTVVVLQAQIDAIKASTANYNNNREAQLEVAAIEAEIADKKEEIFGKLTENETALNDLQKQIAEERAEREQEELEARKAKVLEEFVFRAETYKADEISREQMDNMAIRGIERVNGILKKQREDRLKEEKKAAEKQVQIDQMKNEALIGGIELVTKEKSAARVALNMVFKQDAIRETVTNTYNAAVAAYKSLAGIPIVGPALGAVAAALVTAFGLANVAKITGIQFAQGGAVKMANGGKTGTFEGPSHAGGGIDYIRSDGKHRINVEGDENFYVLKKSASKEINALSTLNQKHGGRSWGETYRPAVARYALGGNATNFTTAVSRDREIESTVRAVMNNMPPVIVTVEAFNAVANASDEVTQRATVI